MSFSKAWNMARTVAIAMGHKTFKIPPVKGFQSKAIPITCRRCRGTGCEAGKPDHCQQCAGTGVEKLSPKRLTKILQKQQAENNGTVPSKKA